MIHHCELLSIYWQFMLVTGFNYLIFLLCKSSLNTNMYFCGTFLYQKCVICASNPLEGIKQDTVVSMCLMDREGCIVDSRRWMIGDERASLRRIMRVPVVWEWTASMAVKQGLCPSQMLRMLATVLPFYVILKLCKFLFKAVNISNYNVAYVAGVKWYAKTPF